MKKTFFNLLILFIFGLNSVFAQSNTPSGQQIPPTTAAKPDHTIKGQYRTLMTKIYNYQAPAVNSFYKNITDTLKAERTALRTARATIATQETTIKKLNTDVTTKDEIISSSNAKIDEIRLLGIPFTKTTYNLVMWGLVVCLGLALTVVILTTTRAKQEARYRIKLYDELSEEFQTYKTKANEKEKKLARELQTERNKLDELNGR